MIDSAANNDSADLTPYKNSTNTNSFLLHLGQVIDPRKKLSRVYGRPCILEMPAVQEIPLLKTFRCAARYAFLESNCV